MNTYHSPRKPIRRLLNAALILLVVLTGATPAWGTPSPVAGQFDPTSTPQKEVYLPLLQADAVLPIMQDQPIWSHPAPFAATEVSLFRNEFAVTVPLVEAELHIFADTRYQVWLDGKLLGRGPARFSQQTHEYDRYELGEVSPGSHLLAVLVQWAPNNRRSESVAPFLRLHLQGKDAGQLYTFASSSTGWKAQLSPAWRQDAALVHVWGLIGPTELLDLRQLPADWMLPGFDDGDWKPAVRQNDTHLAYLLPEVPRLASPGDYLRFTPLKPAQPTTKGQSLPEARYQPRSIPYLESVDMPVQVVDQGLLSPGRWVGELVPPITPTYTLAITATQDVTFTLEALSADQTHIQLDNAVLNWKSAGSDRPDVINATRQILKGLHWLNFSGIPADGLTFSISSQFIQSPDFPFSQGVNAGRRLLLAEPVSQSPVTATMPSGPSTGQPLSLTLTGPPAYLVLDVSRTVFGRLEADIQGPPGTIVDIGWDQRELPGTDRPLPYPGSLHPQWDQVDSWVLDGQARQITTLDERAGRYLLVAVWGQGPVKIRNLRVYEEHYPLTQAGEFHSSDALLDEIWQTGVETLYPSMSDAYADPWRERGQWWGDAYVTDHANWVAFGDSALLKRGLLLMAEGFDQGQPVGMAPNGAGNHMLDYGMDWVFSLRDYYLRTGDDGPLRRTFPVLQDFLTYLAHYKDPTTGLMDIPYDDWANTVYLDTAGQITRYGISTAVNSMYYGTLLTAAEIATWIERPALATLWEQEAGYIKEQINHFLFNPGQQRYITSLYAGKIITATAYAQAWPLVYNLVPTAQVPAVSTALLDLLPSDPTSATIQIFGTYWVLEALGRNGYSSQAIALIENYFGHMLNLDATTWWEVYNSNRYYSSSLTHAWGSSPTWFLTTYVLGAEQTGPASFRVAPSFTGLTQASGKLPLHGAALQVAWTVTECQARGLSVQAPPGTRGEVVLPLLGDSMQVELNTQPIWENGAPLVPNVTLQTDGIHVTVADGSYQFSITKDCPTP